MDRDVSLPLPGGFPLTFAHIQDSVQGRLIFLDRYNKMAHVTSLKDDLKPQKSELFSPPPGAVGLGTGMVEGVWCHGFRGTNEDGTFSESWVSEELGIVIFAEIERLDGGGMTVRLFDIERVEPEPKLFRIPGDYNRISRS